MPRKRSKVFVSNKGNHDYSLAEEFGDLCYLTSGKTNIFQSDNLKAQIEKGLESAEDGDYLVASGHLVPNAIAFHYLMEKFGKVRLLVWIGNKDKYQEITMVE